VGRPPAAHGDPELRELAIETVHERIARPGREGAVVVYAGSYGGFGWPGTAIDSWLAALLLSGRGTNKLRKL